jgi:selenium metabolism protein YedF
MKTIDAKGLSCPRPLIMTKEALMQADPGQVIRIITDKESSLKNLITYLKDQKMEPEVTSEQGIHTILVEKKSFPLGDEDPEAYCQPGPETQEYVVVLKSTRMGEGDPELGEVLMETFLDHLKMQERLPTHVLLYNSGAKLAMKGKSTCQSLSELEELGCRIVICGTCVDHYGLQYDIGVGMISNMVSLTEIMASTGHVVYP